MKRIMCLLGATVLLLAGCSDDDVTAEVPDETAATEQSTDAGDEAAGQEDSDDTVSAEGEDGRGQITVDGTTYAITSVVSCTIGSTAVATGGSFDDGGGGGGFSFSSIEGEDAELTISMTSGSWSAEGDAIQVDVDDDAGTIAAQADITSSEGATSTATFEVTC